MWSDHAALGHRHGLWLLHAVAAGFGDLFAAVLFLGVFDGGLPRPASAGVASVAAPPAPGLCFHGPGGELLDFAPAGRGCR